MSHLDQEPPHKTKDKPFVGSESFPLVLHTMLDEIETQGLSHIVSWQPHGRCFVVHKRKEFVEFIMPVYFRMSKYASFQRQLNLYGFHRITTGQDQKGYFHQNFLRGRKELCTMIHRQQVKGTGVRKPASPATEPNFYLMDYMPAASGSEDLKIAANTNPTNTSSLSEMIKNSSKLASEPAMACSMTTVLYPTPYSGTNGIGVSSTNSVAAASNANTNSINYSNFLSWHPQQQQQQQGNPMAFGQQQQQLPQQHHQYFAPLLAALGGATSATSMQGRATQNLTHPGGGVATAGAATTMEKFGVAHVTAQPGVLDSCSSISGEDVCSYGPLFGVQDCSTGGGKRSSSPQNRHSDSFDASNQVLSPQQHTGPRQLQRQSSGLDRSFDNLIAALLSGTMESSATTNINTPFDGHGTRSNEPPA